MEDRQSKRSSRTSIIKGLNASIRPMNIQMDNHLVIGGTRHYHQETNCKSPTIVDCYNIMNHYASSTSGSNSFGSRGAGLSLSPLSAIENLETPPVKSPQIYGTPMKVDEEVIVMDGILISSIHGEAKIVRSPLDSGSGGGGKNQYRSDICRYWEDSGSCRFGNKCQFAHGKEDLRPGRLPVRTKTKFSETYGSKFRNNHSLSGISATTTTQSNSNLVDTITKTELSKREGLTPTSSTLKRQTNTNPTLISTISIIDWSPEDDGIKDWSPEDDGIKIVVPGTESTKREDVNQHIHEVLYGSTTERTKKRLPVFSQLCSEELQEE
ncbi:hypothetical protein IC582_001073 [Cucumis melo]|uniref:Uncharacterized protein LOC103501245 n=1 Tax=Cucumis melo TaxID=3656 RepID=A0ABM3KIV8_CUCME|nr:uncharacterized protein LOC103501245 [Cucumis melo]XP_050937718.1 uncharacterized protein LOC103501245 [Cucumis melo]XP_050937720.1 uncharacterized protein LOC103501245 [Cucumis melo]XP_050937724.1 uncharacterized protein LOC103501245 [Cucumis melo]XP_050937725.1 uncharacterized protein LOC103501245 [Cucumis melo]XP_050937729.1 uncharacterized protein LOC103501245 [Cucumis melo]XP_050937732.1 uncharacterized protein LOC103501245 [Cucumis melo]XP_050937733.1 uncharacterized protein LOC1035